MRYEFEKIGVTSDYYLKDNNIIAEDNILCRINGYEEVKLICNLLNEYESEIQQKNNIINILGVYGGL